MQQLMDWLGYLIVRVVICLIQATRLETCQTGARWLAYFAYDVLRVRRAVIDDNLRRSFSELTPKQVRRIALGMWEHLFVMACEIAHTPRKVHETNWRRYVQPHRQRDALRYLLDTRPVILVSGHFGNFELTSYMIGLWGFSTHAIARPLDNPYLDRYLRRFRGAHGQYMLPMKGSSADVDRVLSEGGVLALLGDQAAGPQGCWVDFLGRPASCHKAVALLPLISGAPLLVCFGKRVGGPLELLMGVADIADPLLGGDHLAGVKPLTRWYNQALERMIRSAPEQYWWVHRRWKGQPGRRKTRPAAVSVSASSRKAA